MCPVHIPNSVPVTSAPKLQPEPIPKHPSEFMNRSSNYDTVVVVVGVLRVTPVKIVGVVVGIVVGERVEVVPWPPVTV